MALGYAPYLLLHIAEVFKGSTPSTKVTPPGYLRMLLNSSRPNIVSDGIDDGSGHIRDLKVKFRTRLPTGRSATTDNCDIDAIPAYQEVSLAPTMFRKYSIMLEDETIARYMKDASAMVTVPSGGVPKVDASKISSLMREQLEVITEAANGLLGDINLDLLDKQAINFGINQTTTLSTAKTANFPLSTTSNPLTQGMTMVQADVMANEINLNNCMIVGSGLINNYYLQQPAKSAAQNGLDTNQQPLPMFFHDLYASSAWGSNEFGIFEKNAVQFLDINRYTGFKAGVKGAAWFGTLPLPVIDSEGNLVAVKFDLQMEYVTCPTEVMVGGYPRTVNRGWVLHISKSFDQFNIPTGVYEATDRLIGNNGTLRYVGTNL